MAFIKNSTCELITGNIPIINKWLGKPLMIHTAAINMRDNTHTDNHERYHVEHNGWKWFGYSFSIEQDGRIFFSRPTAEIQQYHCIGQNSKSMGICICGNGTVDSLTEEQYRSLLKIINAYQIKTILIHRDFPHQGKRKACPGDILLEDLNRRFGTMLYRA
ncbi:MAG: peptidoglycan recognition protein family protein [Brevinema sp.]